jgi:hypothetical protein
MAERELEARLQAVARALDAEAPAFDPAALSVAPRRRPRATVVALAAALVVAGVAVAPTAVSAVRQLFEVDEVTQLGPAPNVTPPFEGRQVPVLALQQEVPFRVRLISSIGPPNRAYVRDDITGGMATAVYGLTVLTQWRSADVSARIEVVPGRGSAENATVGTERLPALWTEGAARGTFTLIGADGTVHHERFEVGPGALLWQHDGMSFLLQNAGDKDAATQLAARVEP